MMISLYNLSICVFYFQKSSLLALHMEYFHYFPYAMAHTQKDKQTVL